MWAASALSRSLRRATASWIAWARTAGSSSCESSERAGVGIGEGSGVSSCGAGSCAAAARRVRPDEVMMCRCSPSGSAGAASGCSPASLNWTGSMGL